MLEHVIGDHGLEAAIRNGQSMEIRDETCDAPASRHRLGLEIDAYVERRPALELARQPAGARACFQCSPERGRHRVDQREDVRPQRRLRRNLFEIGVRLALPRQRIVAEGARAGVGFGASRRQKGFSAGDRQRAGG
jgi:hypothetical protein